VGLRLLFSLLHLGSYTSLTSKAPKIEVSDNFIFYFIFNKSKFHLLDLKFFSHWCGLLVILFFFCELVFSIRLSHLRKRDVILWIHFFLVFFFLYDRKLGLVQMVWC
jgi:hypothetical protein